MERKLDKICVKIRTHEEYTKLLEVLTAAGIRGLEERTVKSVFFEGTKNGKIPEGRPPIIIGIPTAHGTGKIGYVDDEIDWYLCRGYKEVELADLLKPRLVQKTFW